jgi:acyl dehydratase
VSSHETKEAQAMLTASVNDLKSRVGQVLGESQPHQVTQEQINEFADATGDHQWLHVDVERAKQGPYHGTIAHGFLTVSMLPTMLDECVSISDVKAVVNYGLNKLRFPAPVPAGSTVRGTLTVNSVEDAHEATEVALGFDIRVEGAAKPSAVGEAVFLLYQ